MSTGADLTIRDWPAADFSAMPLGAGLTALWWLGQAGFAVRFGEVRLLIDPYLSDCLAAKYAGKEVPHARMMPPPLDANATGDLDLVFCSHAHSDHMDPDTLGAIARNNPGCRFVVPRAVAATAAQRGVDPAAIIAMNDGESVDLADGVAAEAVAAAHETLRTNDRGEHHYLGYVLRLGGLTIYHSGDCAPYEGLEARLAGKGIDAALLPVNGRDQFRLSRGILGNFTFAEAAGLCRTLDIPLMLAHHFGMFAGNTVDPSELAWQVRELQMAGQVIVPEVDKAYVLLRKVGNR